ncbi:hypothetical protein ACFL1H_06040 [Nanoarchaeota archaeon]
MKLHNFTVLNTRDIKEVKNKIKLQYGDCPELDYVFLISRKDKIYIVNKDVFSIDLDKVRINSLGIYFAELKNNEIRLSIEGSQLVGPKAVENVFELSDSEIGEWLHGYDITKEGEVPGFIIIKNNSDYYGVGKLKNGKISNYVSKVRRLKG